MSIARFRSVLALILAGILACVVSAGTPTPDPKFEKFRLEMLPLVGHQMTVVGTLRIGKHGWWLPTHGWLLYIKTTTDNRTDMEKMNGLGKFSGHEVKAVGILRHCELQDSGNPMISNIPEHFFFDVSDVSVSELESQQNEESKIESPNKASEPTAMTRPPPATSLAPLAHL